MALDEALLENASRLGQSVLRFYGWTEPAATFGYFQKYAGVEHATRLRPLIRRPTGGGIVPHDADWTYSLIFPPGHEWHALRAEESYRRVHEWLRQAFAQAGVVTELAPARHTSLVTHPSSKGCFIGYEKFDLLWRGQKIAGAAQRRNRLGLLIQGSVQATATPLMRAEWEQAMSEIGCERWGIVWSDLDPDRTLLAGAELLSREKYSQDSYNQKR